MRDRSKGWFPHLSPGRRLEVFVGDEHITTAAAADGRWGLKSEIRDTVGGVVRVFAALVLYAYVIVGKQPGRGFSEVLHAPRHL
jgi:hypothetical protein